MKEQAQLKVSIHCKQGKRDNPEQEGKVGSTGEKCETQPEGEVAENSEHGEGEESIEDEDRREKPTALEKILPQFPAARREVFLKVEAVSGLWPPYTARGSAVSGRVFWGGQEVRKRCK